MRISIAAAFALLLPFAASAAEHPKGHEHPKGQEHPAGHEHPATPSQKAAVPVPAPVTDIQKSFEGIVKDYVKAESKKNGGAFVVKDAAAGVDRFLKLERVHRNKIVTVADGVVFACSDFKTVKGGKDKVDLDFYVSRQGDGSWKVSEVVIHKVNGKPRFTYNDKNERVPVR